MASFSVKRQNSSLFVKITGLLTKEILLKGFEEIRSNINSGEKVRILFDLLEIELSENEGIALESQHLNESIEKNVERVAVVLTDYLVNTRAGIAFVHSEKYKVFYDIDSEEKWLRAG